MNLRMLINKPTINLEKDKTYEIDEEQPIIGNDWKIIIPMKHKGKFRYALVRDSEGILV